MSDNKPLIPTTDDGKHGFYIVIVPYINLAANQLRFNTPAGVLSALNTNYGLWNPNWLKYKDDSLRTKTVTDLKDSLEIEIDGNIDDVYGDIPNSALTAADKAVFLIYARKAASSAVVSPIAPGFAMDTVGHLWAKFLFHNTAAPTSKEAPKGNVVYYETYVGAAGIANADVVFTNGNVTSSANHTFHFVEGEVGKTCYIRCFYQTKRDERSPASIILSFVIM